MNSIRSMIQTANIRKKQTFALGTNGVEMANYVPPCNTPLQTQKNVTRGCSSGNVISNQQSAYAHYIAPSIPVQHPSATMRIPPEIPAQIPAPVVKSGSIYRDLMKKHDRFTQRHL